MPDKADNPLSNNNQSGEVNRNTNSTIEHSANFDKTTSSHQSLTTHHSPLTKTLKQYWGYSSFRPLQEEIINAVLSGHDTLALMPTGGGKSLCYQVPAMIKQGICLVISPLIALMKDQVENLRKKGITAFAIYSGMKRNEVINTLKTAAESNCKFLYVSPERLETNLFKEYLPALNISLIAVDEAHCISQWGYDFRPPYLRIHTLREELQGIPILALTASATPEVQKDICQQLHFSNEKIFRQSFSRPNLSYSVFKADAKINKLAEILNNVSGSSIVYCRSRRRTKDIAAQLNTYKINADYYHAGLSAEERSKKQEGWISNNIRTIVCTNAFGMGIDKPDVRVVVHFDLPDCLENYYQEAGRAGRDLKKSYAVLLYQPDEIEALHTQAAQRFPSIETIRNVYQAIANYLQIPAGSGEGMYFDFDLGDFIKKFNLPAHEAANTLKVLEQEGLMNFNEQVFINTRAQFICNKETLYQFERENETLEPLIKVLLRSYAGIFDMPVNIYEKQIAGWLKKDLDIVKQQLVTLNKFRIIEYQPQKDTPQLYLMQARVKAEDLTINAINYKKRKEAYEKRLQFFIQYTTNHKDCRSSIIGNYFGDNNLQPCGVCDNCLQLKKTALTKETFAQIQERIQSVLTNGPVNTSILLQQLKGFSKEKVWEVIHFLEAEKKIKVNADGLVDLLTG
ncbi:MAG: ATP-dependent DNA helicase RecQ [Chitinophagaceae bacterium]